MGERKIVVIAVFMMLLVFMTGCGEQTITGIYSSEDGLYSVEFTSDSECTWYQEDLFFNGTYKKTDNGYQLEIVGDVLHTNTVFTAEVEGDDLIITGGVVDQIRFTKN